MSDLGEILGSILSSISHARRMADEESAALAEYYRQHPLLEGMTVPRIRLPEVVVDLPILLDIIVAGAPDLGAQADHVVTRATQAIYEEIERRKLKVPAGFAEALAANIKDEVYKSPQYAGEPQPGALRLGARESALRATDLAWARTLQNPEFAGLALDDRRALQDAARRAASQAALESLGTPARLLVSTESAAIKDRGNPESIGRLKLTLKEEGLEWNTTVAQDGTTRRRLTPE